MNYHPPGLTSNFDSAACRVLIFAAILTVAAIQPIEGNDSRLGLARFRCAAINGQTSLQHRRKSCNLDFRRPFRHRILTKNTWHPAARDAAWSPPPAQPVWLPLFDGTSLDGWSITNFGGEGEVTVQDGQILIEFGHMLTGITYQGDFPQSDYEIQWEAMRIDGIDFFCGLTFPVGPTYCTLIAAGWAGAVVGLSSIDGLDASENESTTYMRFENGRWYHFRVRVTDDRIRVWIDDRSMIDQPLADRQIETRPEVDLSKPLGIAAWQSRAALRGIAYRRLK